MTPLIQAPSVIPQLILSLCTVSIATCNKLFENMTPFYGDKNKTKILGTVNGKTFYWKIDIGSAVTCMNINTFETAFGKKKAKISWAVIFYKNSGYTLIIRPSNLNFYQHLPKHCLQQETLLYLHLPQPWYKPELFKRSIKRWITLLTLGYQNNP